MDHIQQHKTHAEWRESIFAESSENLHPTEEGLKIGKLCLSLLSSVILCISVCTRVCLCHQRLFDAVGFSSSNELSTKICPHIFILTLIY